jgi:phosphate transport system ATP-binding protein
MESVMPPDAAQMIDQPDDEGRLKIKTEVRAPEEGSRTGVFTRCIELKNVNLSYGENHVLHDITMDIGEKMVTALIGPSGCGKSTLLRCLNRMNDLIDDTHISGTLRVKGLDIAAPETDVIEVRRRIGMVFQKSNPFPKSIYENVVYGLRIAGIGDKATLDEACERSLKGAALWDEVKDRLDSLGSLLSGGQQQRLTIARALSQEPELLMLDEFSIAVDPVTTMRIEDVLKELRREVTIILVTNLVQQARRLADRTAFFLDGRCVEVGVTEDLFTGEVSDRRTRDYVDGRFG